MQGNTTIPKGKIEKTFQKGVLFITYSLLVSNAKSMGEETHEGNAGDVDAKIPVGSRLAQVVEWLKGDHAPLIILDECHKAKNLVASGGRFPHCIFQFEARKWLSSPLMYQHDNFAIRCFSCLQSVWPNQT